MNVYRLLQGYDVRVIEWDAFGNAGTYEPFTQAGFTLQKGFGEHWNIFGGFSMRRLDDNQIASAFNHGFERVFLSISSLNVLFEGLTLQASGDYYRGEDNALQNDNFGGSFQATQQLLSQRLELTGGTAHYLYRFNLFSGNESTNVQTYFVKTRAKLMNALKGEIGYEFENDDFNNFHAVDARLIWSF